MEPSRYTSQARAARILRNRQIMGFLFVFSSNPNSYGTLESTRSFLAKHTEARDEIIECLVGIEKRLQIDSGQNLREEFTGPIVDLLFESGEVLSRRVANGMTFNFRYSSKIAREFVMAKGNAPDHVWEPQTTKAVVSLSTGAQNVIVGGAYFGDHALFIARSLTAGGICHCFELSSDNISMLRKNLDANGVTNVVINQEALWSTDGAQIELAGADSHASPQLADAGGGTQTYVSRTIDQYASTKGLDRIDVIMLDIEGGEFAAIQGAERVLSREGTAAPALICEIHRAYSDWSQGLRHTTLCSRLIELGYEVFAVRDYQGNEPMGGKVVELVDIDSAVITGPPHGFNLLAVKTRARLDPKVFQIVHNVSPKLLHHRDPKLFAPLEGGHEAP